MKEQGKVMEGLQGELAKEDAAYEALEGPWPTLLGAFRSFFGRFWHGNDVEALDLMALGEAKALREKTKGVEEQRRASEERCRGLGMPCEVYGEIGSCFALTSPDFQLTFN